jgi:general secretion pathway protein I
MRRAERVSGFTLLEAMVALVIVALGMMAVNGQLNRYVVAASFIEEKTLASWIATNEITALSVAASWPNLGKSDEDVEFATRKWRCHIEVSATDVQNLRRVDVSVTLADAPERVLHKVSGLIEPPPPGGFMPPHWSAPVIAPEPAK